MFLSIDFGTSSLKLSVLDERLRVLASEKQEYPYQLMPGEKVEEDPLLLLKALEDCCSSIPAEIRGRVELVCYDTYAPSLVLMNESGDALYPIVTHMDRRSRKQSGQICKTMGKERYQAITGAYPFTGGTSFTSLLWFMQQMPALCSQIKYIGHLPTFIHKQLTGRWVIDLANASMTGLYDTVGQTGWSEEILQTFGVSPRWLCPLAPAGSILGGLTPGMAQRLGLRAGTPVAVGTHDVVAAHAGAGNSLPGQVLNAAGSSDMVSILTDTPLLHARHYVRSAGRQNLWQIYGTTSGGFAVEWFREQFCREMDKQYFYGQYLPHCAGMENTGQVSFAPYLAEDRQSLKRRLAAWEGLSLGAGRDEMLASLLYSMQAVLGEILCNAERLTPLDHTIKITGGLASEAILALKGRVFGGYRFEVKEDCPILGNAGLALQAMDKE